MVTRSLVINEATRLWQVHINGHPVDPVVVPQLVDLPAKVNSTSASVLLHYLTMLKTCAGNPDPTYVALGKSKRMRSSCQQMAKLLLTWIPMRVSMLVKNVILSLFAALLVTCLQTLFAVTFVISFATICMLNTLDR